MTKKVISNVQISDEALFLFPPQVRSAEWHGWARRWDVGRSRHRFGRTLVAVRFGVCCRGHGLRGGGWHHPRSSSQVKQRRSKRREEQYEGGSTSFNLSVTTLFWCQQWKWEAGLMDVHPGLRSDDVTGRRPGLRSLGQDLDIKLDPPWCGHDVMTFDAYINLT